MGPGLNCPGTCEGVPAYVVLLSVVVKYPFSQAPPYTLSNIGQVIILTEICCCVPDSAAVTRGKIKYNGLY